MGGRARKAPKTSAGLLLHRIGPEGEVEVFLVHPGGPFFEGRDEGVWSIPKGELDDGEEPLDAALREFREETALPAPPRDRLVAIGSVTQKSGKVVLAWAGAWDVDPTAMVPGTFQMEWPPKSGQMATFPEVDRGAWWSLPTAATRMNPAQVAFLARLPVGPSAEPSSPTP